MGSGRRGALWLGLGPALALAGLALGCGVQQNDSVAFRDDRASPVQVVTTLMGGKNVFVPSTIVVTEGEGRALSFYNTTDIPHGMQIPGLGIEEILQPGEEHLVELPALAGGNVYEVKCHVHPPHRTATLVVLPAG